MASRAAEANRTSSAIERRTVILDLLQEAGSVAVTDLAHQFGVSEVTIRNDLDMLAQQGLVIRQRGGAIAQVRTALAWAFDQRRNVNLEAKARIGARAARLVHSGETILLDAGSTVMELANRLGDVGPLTVVTNAMNVASQVMQRPDVHVILLGGSLSRETISTVGPLVERALSDLLVSTLFLGAHSVDVDGGIVDTSMEVARVKRAMIDAASEVILLADSSKWTTRAPRAFARVAPLAAVRTVVTDAGLPDDARAAMERLGVRVEIA